MNIFYIVRHGETENNRAKRLSGWIDTALTEDGLKPTERVIAKLSKLPIDEMYSSDMGRAFITAYALARGLNFRKEIKRLPGLREVNYGDAANMPSVKAYEIYPRLDRDTHYTPPNGESLDHMQKRVFRTIEELNKQHKDAVIVLVCHSGVMAALRASHIGQDFGEHNISEASSTIMLASSRSLTALLLVLKSSRVSMATYPPVVVVDENDNEVGSAMLAEVWQKGLYHRMASIFIEDEQGRMLLQRRGSSVKLYPNYWDQAAGGHVDEGSTYETTAANELAEELGLHGIKLKTVATYRFNTKEDGKIINQFVRVFLAQIQSNTTLQPQAEEVGKLQWFTPDELKRITSEQPEAFTPGFLHELRTYFF